MPSGAVPGAAGNSATAEAGARLRRAQKPHRQTLAGTTCPHQLGCGWRCCRAASAASSWPGNPCSPLAKRTGSDSWHLHGTRLDGLAPSVRHLGIHARLRCNQHSACRYWAWALALWQHRDRHRVQLGPFAPQVTDLAVARLRSCAPPPTRRPALPQEPQARSWPASTACMLCLLPADEYILCCRTGSFGSGLRCRLWSWWPLLLLQL